MAASPGEAAESRQEWRLQWSPSLIFAELDDRSLIHLFAKVPRRGSILDRSGEKLAFDAEVAVVGIVPDLITDPEATISVLATVLSLPESEVRAQVETDLPSYYFIPIETLPYETSPAEVQKLRDLINLGVVVQEDSLRLYPQGSLAAHLVGYLAEVTADQLDELRAEGYEPGDLVGAFGLEGPVPSAAGRGAWRHPGHRHPRGNRRQDHRREGGQAGEGHLSVHRRQPAEGRGDPPGRESGFGGCNGPAGQLGAGARLLPPLRPQRFHQGADG